MMPTRTEIIKKRWLLIVTNIFQFLIPSIILLELFIKEKKTTLPAFLVVLGILYIGFVSKKVKEKIASMKESSFKIGASELNSLVPFGVVALLVYVSETLFNGFYHWCFAIVGSIFFGSILKVIEFEINRKFIYKCRIYELAKEKVDIDKASEELKSTLEDM